MPDIKTTLDTSEILIKRDVQKKKKELIATQSLTGKGNTRGTTYGKMNFQNN